MYLFINGQAFVTTVLYTCTICYRPNAAFKFFWKVCKCVQVTLLKVRSKMAMLKNK